jgi:hypothetical protein
LFTRNNHFIDEDLLTVAIAIIPESDLQIAGTDGNFDFDRRITPFGVAVKVLAINPSVYGRPAVASSSTSFQIKAVLLVVIKAKGYIPELNLDHRVVRDLKGVRVDAGYLIGIVSNQGRV